MKKSKLLFLLMVTIVALCGCSEKTKTIDTSELTISAYENIDVNVAELKKELESDAIDDDQYLNQLVEEQIPTVVWDVVVSNTEIKNYPEDRLNTEVEHLRELYEKRAESFSISYDEYLTTYMKTDTYSMEKLLQDTAKEHVRDDLIIEAIMDAENLDVSDDDIQTYLKNKANMIGFPSVDAMLKDLDEGDLVRDAKKVCVQNWLSDHANRIQ